MKRKRVKDMGEKEFVRKYASKKAMDAAEERMNEKLRKEKIEELDRSIKRAEDYLKKEDPTLFPLAMAELRRVKAEVDFYKGTGFRLTKNDVAHYDTKVKREIKNLIATADHRSKSPQVNPYQQKIYKSAEDEAKGYLKRVTTPKKGTPSVRPILERLERTLKHDRFQGEVKELRKQFGKEKSEAAVNAYRRLALSLKDPGYQVVCLREALRDYAPNKLVKKELQTEIDNIISYVKKHKHKFERK